MRKSLAVYMPVVLIGWFAGVSPVRAQSELPRNRMAYYKIHADTQDPDSPVLISVMVYLTAEDRIGDEVGWYPKQIWITQYDANSEIVGAWTDEYPDATSTDPLWYVTHDDPMAPTNAEFAKPPELTGTAESNTANGPTMDYYLLGKNTGSPPNTPYPVTSIVDYSFQRSDEPEPVDSDEDEPADLPTGGDDPG